MLYIKFFIIICNSLFVSDTTVVQHYSIKDTIMLDEVIITEKVRSKRYYRKMARRRRKLNYNVRKVYPYAKMAARKIMEIETRIRHIEKKKEKKKIIKQEYRNLMKEFKKPLMKLTITQGRILMKLIHRETKNTTFHHIFEYRGGFNAYFWQSIAFIFGHNLNAKYEPIEEDFEIEQIIMDIQKEKKKLNEL